MAGLNVGGIFARAGIDVDESGFDRFERRLRSARTDATRGIETEARVDTDRAESGLRRYERRLKDVDRSNNDLVRGSGRLKGAMGSLFIGGAGVAGAGLAIGLLGRQAMGAVAAFEESEVVAKRTANVLKTTGGVAGVTAKEVANLAAAISRKTGIDDEAIQSGENLLLTFTNVRNEAGKGNDIFTQATGIMADMSAALGQDTSASAIQLGKALNDPVKGVTALTRVGVSFTAQQKEQIKTLSESGRTTDAQRVILKELNKEFGGAGEAGATSSGKLKVAFGNLQEAAGRLLAPTFNKVADGARKLFEEMESGEGTGGQVVDVMRSLAGVAANVGRVLLEVGRRVVAIVQYFRQNKAAADALLVGLSAIAGGFIALRVIGAITSLVRNARTAWLLLNVAMRANPIGVVITVLAALGAGLVVLYRRSETFRRIVDGAWRAVQVGATQMVGFILDAFDKWLGGFSTILSAAGKLPGPLGAPFRKAAEVIDRAREKVRTLADSIRRLPSKKNTDITVSIKWKGQTFNLGPKDRLTDRPQGQGDGWGISGAIDKHVALMAQAGADAGILMPPVFPLGGGGGLNAFNALAARFGVAVGSGFRPGAITSSGNVSNHALGRARDFPGSPAAMMAFARYIAQNYGSRLLELIYTPLGFSIKNGQRVAPYAQADHYDHVHVAMRHGGRVGPNAGGISVRVAGEGAADEWVISQEGDRRANIGYALDALNALGVPVAFNRAGKGAKPTLSKAENRGITRSIRRGNRGLPSFERRIQKLEREYTRTDRRYGLSDEDWMVENDDGSVTIDEGIRSKRMGELESLLHLRHRIAQTIDEYRAKLEEAIDTYKAAVARLRKALAAAKGKARSKERGGYRSRIEAYSRRIGELRGTFSELGEDRQDMEVDMSELIVEESAIRGQRGQGATDTGGGPDVPPEPPTPDAPETLPPSPLDIAAAAAEQLRSFQSARASLFGEFGQNFMRPGGAPMTEAELAAGARYFGGGGSTAGDPVLAAGPTPGGDTTLAVTFTGPQPADPHTFAQAMLHELKAAT